MSLWLVISKMKRKSRVFNWKKVKFVLSNTQCQ